MDELLILNSFFFIFFLLRNGYRGRCTLMDLMQYMVENIIVFQYSKKKMIIVKEDFSLVRKIRLFLSSSLPSSSSSSLKSNYIRSLSQKKAWFFFKNEIVMMGILASLLYILLTFINSLPLFFVYVNWITSKEKNKTFFLNHSQNFFLLPGIYLFILFLEIISFHEWMIE